MIRHFYTFLLLALHLFAAEPTLRESTLSEEEQSSQHTKVASAYSPDLPVDQVLHVLKSTQPPCQPVTSNNDTFPTLTDFTPFIPAAIQQITTHSARAEHLANLCIVQELPALQETLIDKVSSDQKQSLAQMNHQIQTLLEMLVDTTLYPLVTFFTLAEAWDMTPLVTPEAVTVSSKHKLYMLSQKYVLVSLENLPQSLTDAARLMSNVHLVNALFETSQKEPTVGLSHSLALALACFALDPR